MSGMNGRMARIGKWIAWGIAIYGVVLAAGFFAVKWHMTDVRGVVDARNGEFDEQARFGRSDITKRMAGIEECKADAVGVVSAKAARRMEDAYRRTGSPIVLAGMVDAAEMQLKGSSGYARLAMQCVGGMAPKRDGIRAQWNEGAADIFKWMDTEDWAVFKAATAKDRDVIARVSRETGVGSRMIVAQLVAEQLRLFNSDRAVYKRFFAPLKMLGSETKFSLGVTGIKEETAIAVENNLKDRTSPFYPGTQYERLLDFKTADIASERYARITDEHDHYYAYLYTALYLKEIEWQWKDAGYDIGGRPEIVSTLFNIGFGHSKPKADPAVGGAPITIDGAQYSFGSLGYEFYWSGEMMDEFPFPEK